MWRDPIAEWYYEYIILTVWKTLIRLLNILKNSEWCGHNSVMTKTHASIIIYIMSEYFPYHMKGVQKRDDRTTAGAFRG